MIGIDMLAPAHSERGWRGLYNLYKAEIAMLSQYRRERAIEKIKAQPFFRPQISAIPVSVWAAGYGRTGGDKTVVIKGRMTDHDPYAANDGSHKPKQLCRACGGSGFIPPCTPSLFRPSWTCEACNGTGVRPL